jgi:hypothetical protein
MPIKTAFPQTRDVAPYGPVMAHWVVNWVVGRLPFRGLGYTPEGCSRVKADDFSELQELDHSHTMRSRLNLRNEPLGSPKLCSDIPLSHLSPLAPFFQ